MSLKERLEDFAGALASATNAPDDYPFPEFQSYESNMADLKELWAEIRPQLKRDLEKVELIDAKLVEMRVAFDAGEKDKGCKAVMAIYNLKVEKLR
jgi:t-SNARE complex subunit (syntaxin)